MAEVTEGFGQKAEVAVPEKLVRANGEVGVEEDFQAVFLNKNITLESTIGQSLSGMRKHRKRKLEIKESTKVDARFHCPRTR